MSSGPESAHGRRPGSTIALPLGGGEPWPLSRVPHRCLRPGGEHGDPHRADAGLGGAPALPVRRGAGRAVPLRAQALLVPAADLDLRAQPRRARAAGGRGPLQVFGALDRLGGFFVLTAIRWIGPLVTAVVVAGVAGTAITADLGARKIREELDALQVLGVDPIKNLVVPRFLALMVVTALLDIFAIVFGLTAGIAAELLYKQSLGGFFATLFSNASVTDLWASVLMCTIFGAIISVVCCYKGMTASGGAAGSAAPSTRPS